MHTRPRTPNEGRDISHRHPKHQRQGGSGRVAPCLGILLLVVVALFCVLAVPAAAEAATTPTRYEQTDSHIVKTGVWSDFPRAEASGGSYGRSSSREASATVYFQGTRLDLLVMTGGTPGIIQIYLDDELKKTVDLYSSPARYQVPIWSSGSLPLGPHKVELRRSTASTAGEFLPLDALDIWGTITDAPTRYEQTDSHIVKTGVWSDFPRAEASGGSYGRSSSREASATVYFQGTRLDLLVMTGGTPGIVQIYLDDELKKTVDLYSSPARYQVPIWSSGSLPLGPHKVELRRSTASTPGEFLPLDALDIWGTIRSGPETPPLEMARPVKADWLEDYLVGLTSRLAPHAAYICEEARTYNVPLQLALAFFWDENGLWRESYCTRFPRSWENKNPGNLAYSSWEAQRYPGTVKESGRTVNYLAVFPTVENGIDAWFYLLRVRSSTYSAGVDQILAGDLEGGLETIFSGGYVPDEYVPARVASAAAYYRAVSAKIAAEYGYVGDPDPSKRYEQTDGRIGKTGVWDDFGKILASGGSYGRSNSSDAAAAIHFFGTRLDLFAMKGTTTGIVDIQVDGLFKTTVNLAADPAVYDVLIFTTGTLAEGDHEVRLEANEHSPAGKFITLDAVEVWGKLTAG